MKKIVYFMVFILSIVSSTNVLAGEYNNTENTITKANLIESYIQKHKLRIENFINKYNIKDTSHLQDSIKELNESIIALNKIKNGEIDPNKSEEIINAIIKRIKYINEDLKRKLNTEKIAFEKTLKKKKYIYSNLWKKISEKIDDINIKIAKKVLTKDKILSEEELKVKEHLIKLNKESKKLKYFWNINFKSEKEIKDSFVRILNNIKREVNEMKKSLQ